MVVAGWRRQNLWTKDPDPEQQCNGSALGHHTENKFLPRRPGVRQKRKRSVLRVGSHRHSDDRQPTIAAFDNLLLVGGRSDWNEPGTDRADLCTACQALFTATRRPLRTAPAALNQFRIKWLHPTEVQARESRAEGANIYIFWVADEVQDSV